MPVYQCQAILQAQSDNPEDVHINNFYYLSDGPFSTFAASWVSQIEGFYNAIQSYCLYGWTAEGALFKVYNAQAQKPNYPLVEYTSSGFFTDKDFSLPPEIALCVSYRNVTFTQVPRGRRRGRIYLGGCSETYNGTDARPTQPMVEALGNAFDTYVTNVGQLESGGDPTGACIYSRRDDTGYLIEEVRVDNEWDIQRRRGRRATTSYVL